ncbi:hypothetical protein T4D_6747, partial [Trichinella pseudospiralis]
LNNICLPAFKTVYKKLMNQISDFIILNWIQVAFSTDVTTSIWIDFNHFSVKLAFSGKLLLQNSVLCVQEIFE